MKEIICDAVKREHLCNDLQKQFTIAYPDEERKLPKKVRVYRSYGIIIEEYKDKETVKHIVQVKEKEVIFRKCTDVQVKEKEVIFRKRTVINTKSRHLRRAWPKKWGDWSNFPSYKTMRIAKYNQDSIIVYIESYYEYFKILAETLNCAKIIKCWEGAE